MTQLESTLEAVLFAAGDAVSLDRLCAALETPRRRHPCGGEAPRSSLCS
ncbi:MAG: hypothetical protein ACLR4Z_02195 [Butyricicoccaceae bacterium]